MAKKPNTEAVETTVEETTAEAVETTVEEKAEKKMVEIELFKDNKDYKDDVFVCINGKNIVVKRGEKVKVKKKFADVIAHSMTQDVKAANLMDNKSEEFFTEAAARNI